MDPVTNPAILILATILPVLISVIQQAHFSSQVNAIIAVVVYIVVGVLGAILTGVTPTLENIIPFVTTVGVVGTVAYNLFWDNLGRTSETAPSVADRIQSATTVGGDAG